MPAVLENRLGQRAKDPVSRALIRHLVVPWIYFEAPWPSSEARVDVLAIDRAGTGDVHVVEIRQRAADALRAIAQVMRIPAQFRWVAFFAGSITPAVTLKLLNRECLYPADGPGRVGVIEVVRMQGDDLGANIKVTAERFPGSYRPQADAFVAAHEADICFR